MPRGKKA
jgi:hypothetical protein